MIDSLVKKLNHFERISSLEHTVLLDAIERVEELGKGQDIISAGSRPEHVHLMLEGWACRYMLMNSGRSHIMALLLPGDLCNVHVTLLDYMDHSIRTLSPAKVAYFNNNKMKSIFERHAQLTNKLIWSTLVNEATLRQWLVNQGGRPAVQRIAHLFCELLVRARAAGLTNTTTFDLPLTQEELGEATGLTQVHINRSLRKLREEGLIQLNKGSVEVLDWPRLKAKSVFEDHYLYLGLDNTRESLDSSH